MPAQYKYSKGQNKRRLDHSSSQSHHNHRQKDNKPYRPEKWHKRQRSRSRSNPKQESKYKFTYYPKEKQEHRYNERHFEFKRNNEHRKRDPSDQRRDRNDEKGRESRYVYNRNQNRQRQRQRNDREYRKDDKRQKSIDNKRWRSPESKSETPSPKNNREDRKHIETKYNLNKKSEHQKFDRKENQQNKFKYIDTQQEGRKAKYTLPIKDQQLQQKSDIYQKNQNYGSNSDIKPKFMMRMPPPPPPIRNIYDNIKPKYERQFKKDETKKENIEIKEEKIPKRQQKEIKRDDPKLESINKNPIIQQTKKQKEQHRISPMKRFFQTKNNHQPIAALEQIPKLKISKVELILNQAKINLQIQPPPINFMTLDTFKNMNKFQVETMDQKWVHKIRHQMDKTPEIKQLLSGIPMPVSEQMSPQLWTFLKEERDEQEHDIRFRLEELRMHNTNLNQLVRKLRFID